MNRIKTFLLLMLMASNVSAFDPEAEGAIILFSQVCLQMYPFDEAGLMAFLDQNGVKKLEPDVSEKYARSASNSNVYRVSSIRDYIVILENENLCSIIAEDVSIKSTLREYETLRSGLSKHPDVTEAEELKDKDLLRTKHYTYTKTDGTFLMRVSNSYPLGRSGKGSFILSVVSGARK